MINKMIFTVVVFSLVISLASAEIVPFNEFDTNYWLTRVLPASSIDFKGNATSASTEFDVDSIDGNLMEVFNDNHQIAILEVNEKVVQKYDNKDHVPWFFNSRGMYSSRVGFAPWHSRKKALLPVKKITHPLPEPSTISLVLIGLLSMIGIASGKRKNV